MADMTVSGGTTSANILPSSTGQNLGSDAQRWNLYAQTLDVSGDTTFASLTAENAKNVGEILYAEAFDVNSTTGGIQEAIDALPELGGHVWLPPRAVTITSTIVISKPNVFLHGHGGSGPLRVGADPKPNTILNWGGAAGDTVIKFSAISGSANPAITGGGLQDVAIYGNENAGIGLEINSMAYGTFRNLFIVNCRESHIYLGVVDAPLAEARDVQYNDFSNIRIACDGSVPAVKGAHGIVLDGDSSANTSINTFSNILISTTDGHGIYAKNSDNNVFTSVTVGIGSGGTGYGVYLTGSGSANTAAREEVFFGLEGNGGIVQDGTATGNAVYGYKQGNGAALPVVSAGTFQYTNIGLGGDAGNVTYIHGDSSSSKIISLDSSVAGKSLDIYYSDAGVDKWVEGKNALNDYSIYDATSSKQRLQLLAPSGGNSETLLTAVGGASLKLNYGGGSSVSFGNGSNAEVMAVNSSGVITKYNNVATDGAGIASIQKVVNLVNQTAAITTTNILASVPAGLYRLSYSHEISQAATTSSATQLTIGWNNGYSALTKTGTNLTGNTLATTDSGEFILHTAAATDITYAATYSSTGATPMTFDLTLRLEKL